MEGCIAIEGVDRHVPRTPNGPPYGRVEERAQLPVVLLAGEPHRAYDLARARAALAIAQSLLRDPVFYLPRHIIKRNGSQQRILSQFRLNSQYVILSQFRIPVRIIMSRRYCRSSIRGVYQSDRYLLGGV
eukprot:COSAG01_NODE_3834_length_5650_cov_4.421005_4_plen_130_part_00